MGNEAIDSRLERLQKGTHLKRQIRQKDSKRYTRLGPHPIPSVLITTR